MGFIKFFCNKFFSIKSSILARENWPRSVFLNPKRFTFFEILIPLATANEILIEEKLPGPLLTSKEKLLLKFTLCFCIKSNMLETN